MWKCTKCGRSFRNENQHHFCGIAPKTIDEYIDEQDEVSRPHLIVVRDILRNVLPGSEEKIAWQMPTFRQKKNIIYFAAMKNHLGLYPGEETVEYFGNELKEHCFKFAKGSIQIPYNKEIPEDLVKKIAIYAKKVNS